MAESILYNSVVTVPDQWVEIPLDLTDAVFGMVNINGVYNIHDPQALPGYCLVAVSDTTSPTVTDIIHHVENIKPDSLSPVFTKYWFTLPPTKKILVKSDIANITVNVNGFKKLV